MELKENRSLPVCILLSIITCGIYSCYLIHKMAVDTNIICAADGKRTNGFGMFLLLSIVTCGIYSWIWYYGLGNRLAENAPRYGLSFTENGTTVLMWQLFGLVLCGVGYYVALYIILKNLNLLSAAYNRGDFIS